MEQTHLYSSHHNVNLLTAALLAHNIRHVVVCPGSRNAPIVHNLQVNGDFSLYSVTDERSAAFVALGLWLKVRTGVALCVTSGSALLNTLPGVAEAALRNIPLVIISADRPEEFHGIFTHLAGERVYTRRRSGLSSDIERSVSRLFNSSTASDSFECANFRATFHV